MSSFLCTFGIAIDVYTQTKVVSIVKDVDRDDEMVERLLKLRHLASTTIEKAFSTTSPTRAAPSSSPRKSSDTTSSPSKPPDASTSSPRKRPDQTFVYALTDAFNNGFKGRRSKPAEMIAKYLDKAMRKGQGASTDAEFNAMLDDALKLYKYSDDKDVFRTFYHRSLAKRLLLGKSASNDFEVSMLKKLKTGTLAARHFFCL
jgi:cullin-4